MSTVLSIFAYLLLLFLVKTNDQKLRSYKTDSFIFNVYINMLFFEGCVTR